MNVESLLQIISFAFVSLMTPGPNNLMLMASGTNFGFKRTIPHALGVIFGFGAMTILVGLGLMQVFNTWPLVQQVLKVVSLTYLFYLAFKIATAKPNLDVENKSSRPFRFYQAVLFQWLNPKAWTMLLSAVSLFAPKGELQSILILSGSFLSIGVISSFSWTFFGQQFQKLSLKDSQLRLFNIVMALLLLASVL